MAREDFEGIKAMAQANHDERVSKNPQRLEYACKQLDKHGFNYEVKNPSITQIVIWTKNKTFVFYAGTGKITGYEERGIKNLIRLLKKEVGQ